MVPLIAAWKYYPDNKGLVGGIILGFYGFGSFIYSQIARAIVNPNNM